MNLYFLDECGFAPTQPVGYSWADAGRRPDVPYEAPQRRRVNALVAYCPIGRRRGLRFRLWARTISAHDTLDFFLSLADPRGVPTWVVLDNGNIHHCLLVRRALPRLRRLGVHLFYLPAYCPELNDVEAVFGVIKAQELPERSYSTLAALLDAVRTALRRYHQRLRHRCT